jgi:hypothetical protein
VAIFKRFALIPLPLDDGCVAGQYVEKNLRDAVPCEILLCAQKRANASSVGQGSPKVLKIEPKHDLVREQIQLANRQGAYGCYARIVRDNDAMVYEVQPRSPAFGLVDGSPFSH